jgi:hypothetical protein
MSLEVVRVLVAPAIPLLGHETRRSVPEVQGHGIDPGFREIVLELSQPTLE